MIQFKLLIFYIQLDHWDRLCLVYSIQSSIQYVFYAFFFLFLVSINYIFSLNMMKESVKLENVSL